MPPDLVPPSVVASLRALSEEAVVELMNGALAMYWLRAANSMRQVGGWVATGGLGRYVLCCGERDAVRRAA
jgi:hypothetical protein